MSKQKPSKLESHITFQCTVSFKQAFEQVAAEHQTTISTIIRAILIEELPKRYPEFIEIKTQLNDALANSIESTIKEKETKQDDRSTPAPTSNT